MPTETMMPRFKSHKTVYALKIAKVEGCTITPADSGYAPFEVDSSLYLRYTPTVGDYYVVYEDGYKSFSPAKAFDEGYAPIANETFAQPKITGYRQLSETEVALMNEIKQKGVELGELVFRLRTYTGEPYQDEAGATHSQIKLDQRWISIGATDLQTGLMALTRGVAQPTTF